MIPESREQRRSVALSLAVALLLLSSACRKQPQEGTAGTPEQGAATEPQPTAGEGGMEVAVDDAGVTAKVKGRLAADPRVSALRVDVDTENGIVTLKGDVGSEEARGAAEEVARGTAGVQDVVNMLTTGGGGAAGQGSEQ